MKRTKLLNIFALSALVLGAGASTALADSEGGAWRIFSREIGNDKPAIRINIAVSSEVETAIENNDYVAWQEAVGENHPWADQINEENFNRFAEAWRLQQDGNTEAAQAIYQELGIPGMGLFMGKGMMIGKMDNETKIQMTAALENNDYVAWQEAVGEDHPWAEQINEENFARFAEAWRLKQAGDFEGAQAIYDELGIKMRMKGSLHMLNGNDNARGVGSGMGLGFFGGWGHQDR